LLNPGNRVKDSFMHRYAVIELYTDGGPIFYVTPGNMELRAAEKRVYSSSSLVECVNYCEERELIRDKGEPVDFGDAYREIVYRDDFAGNFRLLNFATGTYYCTCSRCLKQFTGDKRATMCLKCALAIADEALVRIGLAKKNKTVNPECRSAGCGCKDEFCSPKMACFEI